VAAERMLGYAAAEMLGQNVTLVMASPHREAHDGYLLIIERNAAGKPKVRFHDLRHTCATMLLLADVNPKVVSERLGHASIEITLNTHSHVLPTLQERPAEKPEAIIGRMVPATAVS
jgi:integrase